MIISDCQLGLHKFKLQTNNKILNGTEQRGSAPPSSRTRDFLKTFFFSFCSADLEKMSSLERISFLQEKLQDIRNHYLSLKSEVASIDRRRKRMKKKERESEIIASSFHESASNKWAKSSVKSLCFFLCRYCGCLFFLLLLLFITVL